MHRTEAAIPIKPSCESNCLVLWCTTPNKQMKRIKPGGFSKFADRINVPQEALLTIFSKH